MEETQDKSTDEQDGKSELRSQAQRVIDKFGGHRRLAAILNSIDPKFSRNPTSLYRWTYPRERGGTAGVIPTSALPLIIKAARIEGIFLTAEDFYPGLLP